MPYAPKKPCAQPGCGGLTDARYCARHAHVEAEERAAVHRHVDQHRPSASKRGYGHTWQKLRKLILHRDPVCVMCAREAATEVDHIVALAKGGDNALENLQGLCKSCHSRKTATEDGAFQTKPKTSQVTIVCGPPGSGKTTYVRERAHRGDLIIDLDFIFAAISGLPLYDKPVGLLNVALEVKDFLIAKLRGQSGINRAWIVTGGAARAEREEIARKTGGRVIVLAVPAHECLARISKDDRRVGTSEAWQSRIERWWREYEPN